MVYRKMFAIAAALLVATLVTADDKKPTGDKGTGKADEKMVDDATFVKMAASSDLHEIAAGKLALTKSKNDAIKKYAEMMIKDHTKSSEELKTAAKAAGLTVPAAMAEKHQKHLEMLSKAENFDAAYAKHMAHDHEEAVALFTAASKNAKSKELKDFATKTLPVIEGHLEAAKKLPQN